MAATTGKLGLAKRMRMQQLASYLSTQVHFNQDETFALLNIFRQFTKDSAEHRLDRLRFRSLFHTCFCITDDLMLDLLFRAFDKNSDGNTDEEEFIKGLSVLLRGTLEEQIELAYNVYDMNGDGSLAREELFQCLRGCILDGYGIPTDEIDDAEKDIVEIGMRKLDYNRDGQITFDDFDHAVRKDPLMLTSIGSLFPSAPGMATFLSLVSDDYRGYSELWMPSKKHRKQSIGQKYANHRNLSFVPRPSFMRPPSSRGSEAELSDGRGSKAGSQGSVTGLPHSAKGKTRATTRATTAPQRSTKAPVKSHATRPTTAPGASNAKLTKSAAAHQRPHTSKAAAQQRPHTSKAAAQQRPHTSKAAAAHKSVVDDSTAHTSIKPRLS